MKIAITGDLSSGKTTILKLLYNLDNTSIVHIDECIYTIYNKGLKFYPHLIKEINDIFGVKCITDDGQLDPYVFVRIIYNKEKFISYYTLMYNLCKDVYIELSEK